MNSILRFQNIIECQKHLCDLNVAENRVFHRGGGEAAGLYENSRVVERYAKAWIPSKICKIPKLVCDHKKLFEFC